VLQIPVLVLIISVVGQLRPPFFTEMHQILHVAQNYGLFHVWCVREKPEIDIQF